MPKNAWLLLSFWILLTFDISAYFEGGFWNSTCTVLFFSSVLFLLLLISSVFQIYSFSLSCQILAFLFQNLTRFQRRTSKPMRFVNNKLIQGSNKGTWAFHMNHANGEDRFLHLIIRFVMFWLTPFSQAELYGYILQSILQSSGDGFHILHNSQHKYPVLLSITFGQLL